MTSEEVENINERLDLPKKYFSENFIKELNIFYEKVKGEDSTDLTECVSRSMMGLFFQFFVKSLGLTSSDAEECMRLIYLNMFKHLLKSLSSCDLDFHSKKQTLEDLKSNAHITTKKLMGLIDFYDYYYDSKLDEKDQAMN